MKFVVTEPQQAFIDAKADEVLYGGAAGGGKSYVQLIDAFLYALAHPKSKQLVLRRTFPELERSLIRTALEIYPKEACTYNSSKHVFTFQTKSIIEFGFCDADKDVIKYQSAEYDTLRFDEATHFSPYQYEYLRSRLRGANDYPKQTKSSTNPGGEGHEYFKGRFIDPAPPKEEFRAADGTTRLFIPAKVQDNPFLMDADPGYIKRLEALPSEQRKALLDGSWDLFEGQYFPEFSRRVHVVRRPAPDPQHRVYFTMDYGLDMLAAYWIVVDPQNRSHTVHELYEPNLIISKAAEKIKQTTASLNLRPDYWLAPPDLWNRRQETGRSVAEIFAANGIRLTKTNNSRIDGWMAMKEALAPFEDEQGIPTAHLTFDPQCVNAIRCIPAAQHDEKRHNDVSDKPHEITHALDAIRGFCIYRYRPAAKLILPEDTWEMEEERRFARNELFEVYRNGDIDGYSFWG